MRPPKDTSCSLPQPPRPSICLAATMIGPNRAAIPRGCQFAARAYEQLRWTQDLFMPWVWRRLRGRSSADGRVPKRPSWPAGRPRTPCDPDAANRRCRTERDERFCAHSAPVRHPLPMNVEALLHSIPPLAVYLVVGGVVGVESLGVPLPGEIVLVSAALMSSHHDLAVNPIGVGIAAVIGAVVGDSIGYTIGRQFGMPLFDRLGRRFPEALRSRTRRARRKVVQPLGSSGGVLRPLHRAAADLRRAAGRRPENALPALPGGQRFRWHLLGGRHHRARLLRRNGRRTLDGAVLLGRAGDRRRVSACIAAILLRERTSRAIAELEDEHYRKTGTTAADAV